MRTDAFYSFMKERESIRVLRSINSPWPWTVDPILRDFKFTNVKRVHDKTTRMLIEHMYEPNANAPFHVALLNAGIARYFGTYEFAIAAGWQVELDGFTEDYLICLADERAKKHERVFTGAYMITNQGISAPKEEVVVKIFLRSLWRSAETIGAVLHNTGKWEHVMNALRMVEGFGGSGFMAKEVLLDTMLVPGVWAEGTPYDRNTWCPSGPGARRGAARILGDDDAKPLKEEQTLDVMLKLFEQRAEHWPETFVELELHDIQFQLCEFDKYERVRLGQGRPRSRYRPATTK